MSRDFFLPGRSAVYARHAAAATSHPLATNEAIRILNRGGNAVDAVLAAAAVLCVAEPHMTGIGGDCFALLKKPGGEIIALDGAGWLPKSYSPEFFERENLREIAADSPHAVTVPGAVAAWCKLNEDYGAMPLAEILEAAIDCAENGCPVAPRVAFDWARESKKLSRDKAAREIFLGGGSPPREGQIHRQPKLAATLRAIAQGGRDAFYQGDAAADIIRRLRELGGKHEADDFAEYDAEYVAPIAADYRGFSVWECPPSGQGTIALLMLNIMRGFNWSSISDADRIHLFAEITKRAYALRDDIIGDPRQSTDEWKSLLSEKTAARIRDDINMRAADNTPPPPPPLAEHRDTVYLCVTDSEGGAVSFINSIFHPFGSGIVAPNSGILLQNRGAAFSLMRGHPNAADSRRRPLHTIIPAMAQSGDSLLSFGVMGGDYQAAGHAQFLMNLLDLNCNLQTALDLPRTFCRDGLLIAEPTLSDEILADLAKRGHKIAVADSPLGGGQAILHNRREGVITAASDFRKDGLALGF